MSELVSVIVPVYNMENSLEKSARSLLCQDYKNIEIILVDDGSKDNSYDICKKIASHDSRVKCIHTKNRGSGPARNTGIAESKGKYLYFPDADDYLETNSLSVLVEAMSGGKYDLVVFGYRSVTHSGDVVLERTYEPFENSGYSIRENYSDYFGMISRYSIQGAPWNKFFDGDVIRENRIEYPSLRRHQDEGFIARYVTYCKNVRFIPDVLYAYLQNTVSLEWEKYPVDYIDAVIGLNEVWKQTICKWNKNDKKTHELVDKRIFSNIVKALELSYSPKMNFNLVKRIQWVREACQKSGFTQYDTHIAGSNYQRLVLKFARMHCNLLLQLILYIGKIKNDVRQGK